MTTFARIVLFGMLAAAVGVSASCGSSTDPSQTTIDVRMRDNQFAPDTVRARRANLVRWRNEGTVTHNARGSFWQTPDLQPGVDYELRVNFPGTYPYNCTLHAGMTGVLIVQ